MYDGNGPTNSTQPHSRCHTLDAAVTYKETRVIRNEGQKLRPGFDFVDSLTLPPSHPLTHPLSHSRTQRHPHMPRWVWCHSLPHSLPSCVVTELAVSACQTERADHCRAFGVTSAATLGCLGSGRACPDR